MKKIVYAILAFLVLVVLSYFMTIALEKYAVERPGDNDTGGNTTQNTNDESAQNYKDMIVVDYPVKDHDIVSPLTVSGKARGNWFFEASFPIVIVDWDGRIIAEGIAKADGDWMQSDYVPFHADMSFKRPKCEAEYCRRGAIILKKDNPSGLANNDDAFEIPIRFADAIEQI